MSLIKTFVEYSDKSIHVVFTDVSSMIIHPD